MPGSQINTAITIINSKFANGVSITNRDNDSAATVQAGSYIEISNAFFYFSSNEAVTGWSAITTGNTAYIRFTPAGTAGNQTVTAGWSSTAPTYVAAKGGWYLSAGSNIKYLFSAIKHGTSSYGFKQKLNGPALTVGTLVKSITLSAATSSSSTMFSISEPGTFYGKITGTASAGTNILYIQCYYEGAYNTITDTLLMNYGSIARKTTSTTTTTFITLNPGYYRIKAVQATTATLNYYLYRIGRITDVTQ